MFDRRTFSKLANFIFMQILSLSTLAHWPDSLNSYISIAAGHFNGLFLKSQCVDCKTLDRFKWWLRTFLQLPQWSSRCLINLTHRLQLFVCHIFMNYLEKKLSSCECEIGYTIFYESKAKEADRRMNRENRSICMNMEQTLKRTTSSIESC